MARGAPPARPKGRAASGGPPLSEVRLEILFLLMSPRACTVGQLIALPRTLSFWALVAMTLSPLPFRLLDIDGSPQVLRAILLQIETAFSVLLIVPTLLLFAWFRRVRGDVPRFRFLFAHLVIALGALLIGLAMQTAAGLPVSLEGAALRLLWLLVVSMLATAIIFVVILNAPPLSLGAQTPGQPVAPSGAEASAPPGPPALPPADQLLYAIGIGGADLRIETRQGPLFRFQSFADFVATTDAEGGILVRRAVWMFNGGLAAIERDGADLFLVAVDGSRHKVGRTRRTDVRLWARSLLQDDQR